MADILDLITGLVFNLGGPNQSRRGYQCSAIYRLGQFWQQHNMELLPHLLRLIIRSTQTTASLSALAIPDRYAVTYQSCDSRSEFPFRPKPRAANISSHRPLSNSSTMAQNAHFPAINPELAVLFEKMPRPLPLSESDTFREFPPSFALPIVVARLDPLLQKGSTIDTLLPIEYSDNYNACCRDQFLLRESFEGSWPDANLLAGVYPLSKHAMFRYLVAIKSQQDLALIHILIQLCLCVQRRAAVNRKERRWGTSWEHQSKPAAYDPHCAPIHVVSHANLPLASIQVCGSNHLRGKGILCEKVLKENGVKMRLRVYLRAPHTFHASILTFQPSVQFEQDTSEAIK